MSDLQQRRRRAVETGAEEEALAQLEKELAGEPGPGGDLSRILRLHAREVH